MKLKELEVKLRINSDQLFQVVYEKCIHLFGSPQSHTLQLDEYYDTSDGQLKKEDLVIRIRTCDTKKIIALKSPRIKLKSGMTQRIELEFLAAEGEHVLQQLTDQGLHSKETLEKERWMFMYKGCEIALDTLPFIGAFMEIEGPSETAIHDIIAMLDLGSCQVIRKNYGQLLREEFHRLHLPMDTICATFVKEIEHNKREHPTRQ